jgi:uncharacterized protein YggE
MTSARQLFLVGISLGLTGGLLVGSGPLSAARSAAPSAALTGPMTAPAPIAPPTAAAGASGIAGSGGAAASGSGVAYPAFTGTTGLAPDHTIVVTGSGQATVRADGANRAAAERSALAQAVADARSQAEAIAAASGLQLRGVLSVSASVSPFYPPMPYAGGLDNGSGPALPGAPAQTTAPAAQFLYASVTVLYQVT